MKRVLLTTSLLLLLALTACTVPSQKETLPETYTIDKSTLLDKIKGGWAGQTIGCTYGGPTEFQYKGTIIQDFVPLEWEPGIIKWYFDNQPGLYDDVYMDLTFVAVLEKLGLDAPVDSFALAYARSEYPLWHANQVGRFNILQGIMPPQSGHWKNNPHADCIDYQIEADYAGLVCPGMPNSASQLSDKVGHIMNYGDGWYGGVFVGAMYSLAFITDNVELIVSEALKTIPEESRFHRCISDVIRWYKQYPDDWSLTWNECQKNYSEDIGCPDGVLNAYDIDAVINSAYVVIGMLYGQGDFDKTIEIATRCGQDSDCNPATAGGIIGTMLGYSHIPEKWMPNLREVEDRNFAYTDYSLNRTYEVNNRLALQMIERNGGSTEGDKVTIKTQKPEPVRLEQGFTGLKPLRNFWYQHNRVGTPESTMQELKFKGTGIVVRGAVSPDNIDYVAELEVYIDGKLADTVKRPARLNHRSVDLYWNYDLTDSEHTLSFKWLNPRPDASVWTAKVITYGNHQ